jgi:hypothetical protein
MSKGLLLTHPQSHSGPLQVCPNGRQIFRLISPDGAIFRSYCSAIEAVAAAASKGAGMDGDEEGDEDAGEDAREASGVVAGGEATQATTYSSLVCSYCVYVAPTTCYTLPWLLLAITTACYLLATPYCYALLRTATYCCVLLPLLSL